jgi:LysM repeat protein
MVDGNGPAPKWPARVAAPLAFFAAVTVLIVLVQRGLNSEAESTPTLTTPAVTAPTATGGPTTTAPSKRRVYRVRAGDTLESIAARFDTTTDKLLELNPTLDPLALQPGQRIRVA